MICILRGVKLFLTQHQCVILFAIDHHIFIMLHCEGYQHHQQALLIYIYCSNNSNHIQQMTYIQHFLVRSLKKKQVK